MSAASGRSRLRLLGLHGDSSGVVDPMEENS
jgi:hypothetical protein